MSRGNLVHGDFSGLASSYASHRPGYSPHAIRLILGAIDRPAAELDAADVGAGTGIWSRQVQEAGFRRVTAVEPNDEMRQAGRETSTGLPIEWKAGSAERTGLADASTDLLTMASSFHWADFDTALAEFRRVLRPEGWFAALWNTRYLDRSPLLLEFEAELKRLVPDMKRVSSGNSAFTDGLVARFMDAEGWADPVYAECFHVERMSRERYIGAWRSVNDVQVQAGPERFAAFIDFVEKHLADHPFLDCQYRTRIWLIQRL
ncbi:MAG: class I SAM-dependent methyltransferase [Thalassobaculum sp.]|uniref:class I SAM-dependent methyltransferase n=1 Tax=Thalassobaculum sp. TaxID=2022740 RepID=UPI0032F08AF8